MKQLFLVLALSQLMACGPSREEVEAMHKNVPFGIEKFEIEGHTYLARTGYSSLVHSESCRCRAKDTTIVKPSKK